VFFFLVKENYAQIYLGDPNWTLQKQDNFDSLKLSNWKTSYPWTPSGVPVNNGGEYNSASNLLYNYTSGFLSIKCEKLTVPINYPIGSTGYYGYQSGIIWSKFSYKYGYWEISAKLPAGYQGYWPAFWLYGQGSNSCTVPPFYNKGWKNEIDIVENGGFDSKLTDNMGVNYHWTDFTTCRDSSLSGYLLPSSTQTVPGNVTNIHKYGMFWEPGKMTWYFDNVPVKTIIDPIYTPDHAINTIINFAVDPPNSWAPDPLTVFPAYFEIDYLNIYQLNTPTTLGCNDVINSCTFNPGTYVFQVKKSVSIGGSGCTSSINTTNNIHFWATDFVLLDEGTTITSGGSDSFSASITSCPN
jgi:beta-glucanase (GH16 family)